MQKAVTRPGMSPLTRDAATYHPNGIDEPAPANCLVQLELLATSATHSPANQHDSRVSATVCP
jgi:hypothetical protein